MVISKLKHSILLPIFLLLIINISAQSIISGYVKDNKGIGLPGVSIIIEGTTVGTTTNFDGYYTISGEFNELSVLVFSYIGFKTQNIKVNGQSEINVQMEEDVNTLKEVVIIGYGSQLKKDITGSVSTIKEEALESRPITQVGTLLQGQSSGVQVLSNSGKPSAGISIRIRGTSSITSSSEPLYVIDGVPTTDTRSINPNDVETISVLKDASSAAIYGAQGANGVV